MQHPLLLAHALDPPRRAAGRGADGLLDLVDQRAHEPAVGCVEHDEQLGDGEDLADVEHDDVAALLLVGGAGGERRDASGVIVGAVSHRRSPAVVGASAAVGRRGAESASRSR